MNLWPVEHFCTQFFFQISADLEKTGDKMFNWSEVHFYWSTSYKIHTLVRDYDEFMSNCVDKETHFFT